MVTHIDLANDRAFDSLRGILGVWDGGISVAVRLTVPQWAEGFRYVNVPRIVMTSHDALSCLLDWCDRRISDWFAQRQAVALHLGLPPGISPIVFHIASSTG